MTIDLHGERRYKIALHLHTTLSDGHLTPEEVAAEYLADGYDMIALTDHWHYGEGRTIGGLPILAGAEYNLSPRDGLGEMHLLGLGMTKDPGLTPSATRQEIVDGIRSVGGVAVLAHPNWSLNTPADAAALHGIFLTEIYNAVSEAHESNRPCSGYFVDLSANEGNCYGLLATDDAHYYDGSDNRRGYVMVRAQELTPSAVLDALYRRDFYATQGPELLVEREGDLLMIDTSPCEMIATMSNLPWVDHRVLRGKDLTRFVYRIKPDETWIRVEARDSDGCMAWSNLISL